MSSLSICLLLPPINGQTLGTPSRVSEYEHSDVDCVAGSSLMPENMDGLKGVVFWKATACFH